MKKITLLFLSLGFCLSGWSQTLNQNASWPNTSWTVTGTYNTDPTAFESDPTLTANFAFDDDDAGNGSDDQIAAESPMIDLTGAFIAGETWVTISGDFVYNYNDDDILQFEYWDADASTWNIIGTPFNADTAGGVPINDFCAGTPEAYTTVVLDIAGFNPQQLTGFKYRIYFDDLVGGPGYEWGFCFDSPTITSATPPTCLDPSVLTVSNITDTTADLAWTENGSATVWDVEIVPAGTAPTGTPTSTGVSNPYTATGLTENMEYDYYVRAECDGGGFSAYVGPVSFSTLCSPIVPDALETFDTFVPDCWQEATDGDLTTGPTGYGSGDWGAEEFAHSSSSGGGAVNINLYRSVASDWIVSPLYDLSAGGYELNVDVAVTNYNSTGADNMGSDDLVILAYTTDGTTWTALQTWDVNNQPATAGETYNDALTGINSATVRFGIYATDGSIDDAGVDYDFHVDNFQIRTPPSCPVTSNLTLVSNTDTTATINFDSGNATSSGNYEYSVTTVSGATPAVSGSWSDVAGANPNVTYTITGLTAETEYFIHVREVCGTGDESPWTTIPLNFTTNCASVTTYPYTTDFTANVPNACWDEAGSGEIVDGPMSVGFSDWKAGRSYENVAGTATPSNLINLFFNNDREWLISESYDMSGTSNDVLSIEVAVTGYQFGGASDATDTATMGSDDQVDLLITTDGGMTWTSLMTWTAANQPSVTGTREFIDLSSYTGTVQFAFFASDGTVNDIEDYDFHVGMFIIDGTAGNEDVFASTLSLYPNPVNGDVVTISMDQTNASSIEVAVFNTLGQQVMTRSYDQVNQTINIDNISSLSQGMYFVKLSSGTQQATLKFIKE